VRPPIPNSYWVIPGKLLAGEHPAGLEPVETEERLAQIVGAGVRRFIDLTHPGELPEYEPILPAVLVYERFPIRDHGLPGSVAVMRDILLSLEAGLATGEAIYVHCRAGIGRTGTVVGCFLRERGASGDAALDELNRLWLQSERAKSWPTVPETGEQHDFVLGWQPARPVEAALAPPSPIELAARSAHKACLVGLAIGDIAAQPGAPTGERGWTDETALTLCIAESLLQRQGFDGRDQLERMRRWAQDPAAEGAAPGAVPRPSVQEAFKRSMRNLGPLAGSHDPNLIDAAPIARSVAAALFATTDPARAIALGGDVARVTHQAPLAVDTCRLFTGLLVVLLGGRSREAMLGVATRKGGIPLRDEVLAVARGWSAPPGGRRSQAPAILGCLDRAVRAFLRTESFEAGLLRLLDAPGPDPDATLAAYGALAGAHYREAGLPPAWRLRIAGLRRVEDMADRLFVASRTR
jgi:ADP-ribosylglycohydrolase